MKGCVVGEGVVHVWVIRLEEVSSLTKTSITTTWKVQLIDSITGSRGRSQGISGTHFD